MNVSGSKFCRNLVKTNVEAQAQESNLLHLKRVLDRWVSLSDGSSLNSKKKAKQKILDYFKALKSGYFLNIIDLSELDLHSIPPLPEYLDLRSINLSKNKIKVIQDSFLECLKVSDINLSYNLLTEVKRSDFSVMPKLHSLNLNCNTITHIDPFAFLENHDIHTIYLSENKLSSVMFQFSTSFRVSLYLLQNPLTFESMLDLYKYQQCLGHHKLLITLPFETNAQGYFQLTDMHPHFKNSPNSSLLKVPNPYFYDFLFDVQEWVSENDGTPSHLKLIVQDRILEAVNTGFVLRKSLDLSGLSLETMPPLYGLKFLTTINFSYNNLKKMETQKLPTSISLNYLNFSYNKISHISSELFPEGSSIRGLDFSYNDLVSIPSNTFDKLSILSELFLSHNEIESIDLDNFSTNEIIQILDLSFNKLPSFSSNMLRRATSFKELNLDNNRLISFAWFDPNRGCRIAISLQNNPFSLSALADLNALQNMSGYRGPRLHFSVFSDSNLDTTSMGIPNYPKLFQKWKITDSKNIVRHVKCHQSNEVRFMFEKILTFLARLYNEVPRSTQGAIPESVTQMVQTILSTLNRYNVPTDLLETLSANSENAIDACVDKVGIGLTLMDFESQKYDAIKTGNLSLVNKFSSNIAIVRCVTDFLDAVDLHEIVLDTDQNKYVDLKSVHTRLTAEGVNLCSDLTTLTSRDDFIFNCQFYNIHLLPFIIGDQVEDVLLILNALIDKGCMDAEPFATRYGRFATLSESVDQACEYIVANNPRLFDGDLGGMVD